MKVSVNMLMANRNLTHEQCSHNRVLASLRSSFNLKFLMNSPLFSHRSPSPLWDLTGTRASFQHEFSISFFYFTVYQNSINTKVTLVKHFYMRTLPGSYLSTLHKFPMSCAHTTHLYNIFTCFKGNEIEWKHPRSVDLTGVEFKALASGSHTITRDFMYVYIICVSSFLLGMV